MEGVIERAKQCNAGIFDVIPEDAVIGLIKLAQKPLTKGQLRYRKNRKQIQLCLSQSWERRGGQSAKKAYHRQYYLKNKQKYKERAARYK